MLHVITKQQGFVLVITLLFMQIIALLSLYTLESSVIEKKTLYAMIENQKMRNALNKMIKNSEDEVQHTLPACIVPRMSQEELILKPILWWESQTCSGNFQSIQYYYIVESLGEDVCSHIKQKRGQIAEYFRITLCAYLHNGRDRILIQSTIIRPLLMSHECKETVHIVEPGRQGWCAVEGPLPFSS